MADNQITQELAARVALLEQAMAEGNETYESLTGATEGLTDVQKRAIKIGEGNQQSMRNVFNGLLDNNRVSNMLTDSIKRADRINTKALGSNVTLQKVIDANSVAINNSNIGYLRAAEAFITNFEGGVRKTSGGTLKLTEQLIRTGQSTDGMISMNRNLLGVTGRNYDALSKVNDAVLESSDTYTISTGKLVDSLNRLQSDINQFSMFGPDVAANIQTEMADVLGKFQGLNEDSMGSFFSLLEPSLDKIGTREMFGISDFAEQFARGEASSEQIQATMQSVGQQIQQVVAGADNYAVAAELVQRQFRVSQEQAVELVNISKTLAAGPDDAKNMQATQEEQLETIKNQTELANEYYQKVAPAGLQATVALLQPAIQTAQGINALSMFMRNQGGGTEGGGGLLDSIMGDKDDGKKSSKPTGGKRDPATGVLIENNKTAKAQTTVNKKGFSKLGTHLKGVKTGILNMPGKLKGFLSKPGLGSAAAFAGGALGLDALGDKFLPKGLTQNVIGGVTDGMSMVGMAKSVGLAGNPVAAITAMVADPLIDATTEALGAEKGDMVDSAGDVGKWAAAGAAIGSFIPIPGVGTGVGALIGAGAGLVKEYFDLDGERAELEKKTKEAVERQERELRMAREAERARMEKSDVALMSIVNRVTSQQAEYMKTASAEQIARLTEVVSELKQGRVENAQREAGRKSKDLNS